MHISIMNLHMCDDLGIKHVFYALTSAGPPRVVLKPEPERLGF